MALITLNVNGRGYEMACDDGQEEHLRKLGEYVDEKVQGLVESAGQAGEKRVLVMASLLIADELFEAYRQIHALGAKNAEGQDATEALNSCAERLEMYSTPRWPAPPARWRGPWLPPRASSAAAREPAGRPPGLLR